MARKRRNIFLYLAIACFVALIAIFVVDGYMGIYDTLHITAGEHEQTVETDRWLRIDKFMAWGVDWGDKVFFSYEVANHRFSGYSTDVEVSVWRSKEKVSDLLSERLEVGAFGKERIEWVLDSEEFKPEGVTPEQPYEYTVVIKRGEVERKILVSVGTYSGKPVPVPAR